MLQGLMLMVLTVAFAAIVMHIFASLTFDSFKDWDALVRKQVAGKILLTTRWKVRASIYHRWYLLRGADGRLGVLCCPISTAQGFDRLARCETDDDRRLLAKALREETFWANTRAEILEHVRNEKWNQVGSHKFAELAAKCRL